MPSLPGFRALRVHSYGRMDARARPAKKRYSDMSRRKSD